MMVSFDANDRLGECATGGLLPFIFHSHMNMKVYL